MINRPELLTYFNQLDYLIYDDGSDEPTTVTSSLASSTSYVAFSSPLLCIDGLEGRQYLQHRVTRLQRMLIFVKPCYQIMTSASRPSINTGAIVGGVIGGTIILVLVAVGIVYFLKRRRSRRDSQRYTFPVLESEGIHTRFLPPGGQSMSMAATTQVPFSSHFYALSRMTHESSQTAPTFRPQHSNSSHTDTYTSSATGSNVSRARPTGLTLVHNASNSLTSSTIPPSSPGMTNLSSLRTLPEVDHGLQSDEKLPVGRPRQGAAAGRPPPSNFYTNVVGNLIQAEVPNEPVEEGLMSRHASMATTLPPYSPGAFRRGETPPIMPQGP